MNATFSHIAKGGGAALGALALPVLSEVRVKQAQCPATDRWRQVSVAPRGSTLLGISVRPLQANALGLNARATLETLLGYPFQVARLGAYWDRIESGPGRFSPEELDRQVDAAQRAGKQIILGVGAVKNFGYPEFFVPSHQLPRSLREGRLVKPDAYRSLLTAATTFIRRIVERYRDMQGIIAWQVEHEAVDPLGMEHSWRLAMDFAREEVETVRAVDATRPIVMNGFWPSSLLVRLHQWWRTRDQGDSLAAARQLADIVGVDYYPRHALAGTRPWTLYMDGSRSPWQRWLFTQLAREVRASGRRLMISEGQAEPWETTTTPPNPLGRDMYSCRPEHLIENYNRCLRWSRQADLQLHAYLFWGAEYWVRRQQSGDSRYLRAFARILEHA